ncbi:MAG: hypothetical protein Q8Q09_03925 [Deltaproteobacteria bacterium]|nr:hypothetical protein [Deltaproteobacteria bacterium]
MRTEISHLTAETLCLTISGCITHLDLPKVLEAIGQVLELRDEYLTLVTDFSELQTLDPGVVGRVIAHAAHNNWQIPASITITRSQALATVCRAGAAVFKTRDYWVVGSRAEALEIARGRAARERIAAHGAHATRRRLVSGEVALPAAGTRIAQAKRHTG